jgi:hypothetical protein
LIDIEGQFIEENNKATPCIIMYADGRIEITNTYRLFRNPELLLTDFRPDNVYLYSDYEFWLHSMRRGYAIYKEIIS